MGKNTDILERKVIHAGKTFIHEGEDNNRAYIIQTGHIKGYVTNGEERIEVSEHMAGDMVGEVSLVVDGPAPISYEAIMDSTVITVTRQEFGKKLMRIDKSVKTILDHMTQKLQSQDQRNLDRAFRNAEIDEKAYTLMRSFTVGLTPEKRYEYETAILPHINSLVKAIRDIKTKERHSLQAETLEEKVAEITGSEA